LNVIVIYKITTPINITTKMPKVRPKESSRGLLRKPTELGDTIDDYILFIHTPTAEDPVLRLVFKDTKASTNLTGLLTVFLINQRQKDNIYAFNYQYEISIEIVNYRALYMQVTSFLAMIWICGYSFDNDNDYHSMNPFTSINKGILYFNKGIVGNEKPLLLKNEEITLTRFKIALL